MIHGSKSEGTILSKHSDLFRLSIPWLVCWMFMLSLIVSTSFSISSNLRLCLRSSLLFWYFFSSSVRYFTSTYIWNIKQTVQLLSDIIAKMLSDVQWSVIKQCYVMHINRWRKRVIPIINSGYNDFGFKIQRRLKGWNSQAKQSMSMQVLWSCAHPEIKEITPNYDKQNDNSKKCHYNIPTTPLKESHIWILCPMIYW